MRNQRVTVPELQRKKERAEKIAVLTAYDATMARLLDRAGVDALLVGDSLGMVVLGYDTTVPVTIEQVIHHTQAVSRGAARALVIADMPFLSYQVSVSEAVRNAGRLLQEGGASAVKLEGGQPVLDVVKRLVDVGIPVMGHLGLLPQSVNRIGGYGRQATSAADADALAVDARRLEEAGAFAIVLESIPPELARAVTGSLSIPTIGIGAGPDCDGQVLVSYDMLGLFDGFVPSFVKQYAHLAETVVEAARTYVADVRQKQFPASPESVADVPRSGR
ncbi:MAG TPA: 3-methyl-2-oxobutanoate hydroxymethyltransferase [Vicinamibacterales bacterium]|nr:3-methyl-2-oxobutanoate hydroxymethyltransferase [Vicinamibacterales bacterium]